MPRVYLLTEEARYLETCIYTFVSNETPGRLVFGITGQNSGCHAVQAGGKEHEGHDGVHEGVDVERVDEAAEQQRALGAQPARKVLRQTPSGEDGNGVKRSNRRGPQVSQQFRREDLRPGTASRPSWVTGGSEGGGEGGGRRRGQEEGGKNAHLRGVVARIDGQEACAEHIDVALLGAPRHRRARRKRGLHCSQPVAPQLQLSTDVERSAAQSSGPRTVPR